jgi:uncharacterized membrane protein
LGEEAVLNSMVTLCKPLAFIVIATITLGASREAAAQTAGLFELWVGHELVDCPSDPARLCYQTKTEQYDEWSVYEGSISNFYYREGVAYILLVELDPALDDREPRRTRYRVVQVLEEFETFDPPEIPDRVATSARESDLEEVTSEPLEPPTTADAPAEVPAVAEQPTPSAVPISPTDSTRESPVASEPRALPPPAPARQETEVVPTPSETPPAQASVAPTPVEPPAPVPISSPSPARAIPGQRVRGTLVIGSGTEARSFTPCGDSAGIWIEDESGQELWKVYRGRVQSPNQPLLIDVRGEMGSPPRSGFGAHYERQITVAEVLEVHAPNIDCRQASAPVVEEPTDEGVAKTPPPQVQPAPGPVQLVIAGGSPSWTVSIDSGGILYSGPSGSETVQFPYVTPDRTANRVTYATSTSPGEARSLKVVLDKEPCPDPITGLRREFTAYITLDGSWLRGCVTQGDPLSTR